jgi:hypothetical protein
MAAYGALSGLDAVFFEPFEVGLKMRLGGTEGIIEGEEPQPWPRTDLSEWVAQDCTSLVWRLRYKNSHYALKESYCSLLVSP